MVQQVAHLVQRYHDIKKVIFHRCKPKLISIKMLAAILKVFPFCRDTYESLFWKDTCRKSSAVHAPCIKSDSMFVLLETSISIMPK